MITANLKIIEGKLPLLISAPHVFSHKRPSLNGVYKRGEYHTDEIVESICETTNSWGIHTTGESDYDPNYQKEKRNPYKQEVKRIVMENKIKRFVDIHGLKDGNSYDIAIYYPSKFTRSIKFAQSLSEGLGKGKLRDLNIVVLRFLDNGQETLGEYAASKLRIPSIQIEIARYIREDRELMEALVKNLSSIFSKEII